MNIRLKFFLEDIYSGCNIVHNILCKPGEKALAGEPLIVFSNKSKTKFHNFNSSYEGCIKEITIQHGQAIEIGSHLLTITVDPIEGGNMNLTGNDETDEKSNTDDQKLDSDDIGCLSFLIRSAFVVFYFIYPTYETTFVNRLSEEFNRIQFWIGLLATLPTVYYISFYIVSILKDRKVKPKLGVLIILLLNILCWFILPNLFIDISGDLFMRFLDNLDKIFS